MNGIDPAELAGPVFYIGEDQPEGIQQHLGDTVALAREHGYDFVTIPITNKHYYEAVLQLVKTSQSAALDIRSIPPVPCLTPEFTSLRPSDVIGSTIAVVSPWADVASADPIVAHISRQAILVEVAYAAFCGAANVVMPPLFRSDHGLLPSALSSYASLVSRSLTMGPYLQILLPFPMDHQRRPRSSAESNLTLESPKIDSRSYDDAPDDPLSAWDAWDYIRARCRYAAKLAIVLNVPRLLPTEHLQSRWYAEPLRMLQLDASTFPTKQSGYPVLSKAHQALLHRYMRLQQAPWMLLSNLPNVKQNVEAGSDPTPAEAAHVQRAPIDSTPHLSYLRHLQSNAPALPPLDRFARGYQDFLQSPLQPLADNLESITYEVFEKDPIKYSWYEKAITLALRDVYANIQRPVILAVVGAGRGPLMTRALMASEAAGVPIIPYAIEKNPNAYVLLQHRNSHDSLWAGRVQVVKTDMRAWSGPTDSAGQPGKVDIFVSELLGSFADNELSPECLDGAQHLLHPQHGISIPQSYTAWVTPITSPRIHADLLHRPTSERDTWDLSYVSMLHQFAFLSYTDECLPPTGTSLLAYKPDIQQCWEFVHPTATCQLEWSQQRRKGGLYAPGVSGGDGWNEHNARSCNLTFSIPRQGRGLCHGLAGYFETILYTSPETDEKVELSTNPNTMDDKSKDMISWFPIFFPLKTPLQVPDGAELQLSMERKTDDRKVWYEWQVDVWCHVNGVMQRTAGSGLHGTRDTGCLM